MPIILWHDIIYPIPNITFKNWECTSNFIPYYMMNAFTYPCWDLIWSMLLEGAQATFSICAVPAIAPFTNMD